MESPRGELLDLAAAEPAMLERFLRTGSIRRVQTIHRKARELLEERGIRAAYLATGLARWDELFLQPAAPVLLRGLTITPTRARHDDFELGLDAGGADALDAFEAGVRDRLALFGITVVPQYGVGGFRVDFVATHPRDPERVVLAIEADGPSYRDSRSTRDRDRLREERLERLGWSFRRLWSTNWFHNPQGEIAKLRQAYERAVEETPGTDLECRPSAPGGPPDP
ncbi:DUF4011 domain-containing protein [Nonomuraea sp. NPDC050663]|uniref:DUF4011 domain-containing protein n=1 Tax=Nonomuraea sp. NPDC050663 TaxID=3364370 RepID=UPI0037B3EC8C